MSIDTLENPDIVQTAYWIAVTIEGQPAEACYKVRSAEAAAEAAFEETSTILDSSNRSCDSKGDIIDRVVNRVEDLIAENKSMIVEIADGYRLSIEPA